MTRFPESFRATTASLHELGCSGPTVEEGCVCHQKVKGDVVLLAMHSTAPDWQVVDYATNNGIDTYLSSLESVLIALEQRALDTDQLDRFARLLQYGERMALTRVRRRGA